MNVMAASLPARATQKSWVGLKTVPSAISPETKGQPSVPPVANFRKPAADQVPRPSPMIFSRPAHRKMIPMTITAEGDRECMLAIENLHGDADSLLAPARRQERRPA